MMPEGWEVTTAEAVCESISVGVVIKPSQYYVDARHGVRAFRSANVREGFVEDSDWVYFSEEGHQKNRKSEVRAGDVLIVRSGFPGTACVVTEEFAGANAIDIVIARPDQRKIDPRYLCAYTNSSVGKAQVLNLQGGMAQKHLNVGAYKTLVIKLPPLVEQNKIAEILSTWDKAITTTQKLLANRQLQKVALMRQLLTGKRRLPGFADAWRSVMLGEICELNPRRPAKAGDGKVSFIAMESVSADGFVFGKVDRAYADVEKGGFSGFIENDVLVAKITPCFENGKGALAENLTNGIGFGSTEFHVLRASEGICPRYIYYVTRTREFRARGEASMQGSAGHRRVSNVFLRLYKVSIPPTLEEQQSIATLLSKVDQSIDMIRCSLRGLQTEKKALQQQLLTGRRRIK